MNIVIDNSFSWIKDLNKRSNINIGVKTRLMFGRLRSRSDV